MPLSNAELRDLKATQDIEGRLETLATAIEDAMTDFRELAQDLVELSERAEQIADYYESRYA